MNGLKELIAKLENDYDFQCEAGPLKNCVDWHALVSRIEEVEKERDAMKAALKPFTCSDDVLTRHDDWEFITILRPISDFRRVMDALQFAENANSSQ